MKPNQVKVTIEGIAGSGKSGIGALVAWILNENGINATFTDLDGTPPDFERMCNILVSLEDRGTEVSIIEQQAHRDSYATY